MRSHWICRSRWIWQSYGIWLAATLCLVSFRCAEPARAQAPEYPNGKITFIVGFAPGGGIDTFARVIAQGLGEQFGYSIVIENRPGAGSNIGAAAVVNAPSDGQTLLLLTAANAINATLYENLSFDTLRDIVPVAGMTHYPIVMLVNPAVPAKTLPEFIAYAKANPGIVSMTAAGMCRQRRRLRMCRM